VYFRSCLWQRQRATDELRDFKSLHFNVNQRDLNLRIMGISSQGKKLNHIRTKTRVCTNGNEGFKMSVCLIIHVYIGGNFSFKKITCVNILVRECFHIILLLLRQFGDCVPNECGCCGR
jgi:hypothetical protein